VLRALSHLALYPALYAAASIPFLFHFTGRVPPARTLALAIVVTFLTALGAYLLDRVKLRAAWLDPADIAAEPRRYRFLTARLIPVRCLALLSLVLATVTAALLPTPVRAGVPQHWPMLLPLLSAVGVTAYAHRARRTLPRPKDVLLIKNAYTAAGITGFASLVVLASQPTLPADLPAMLPLCLAGVTLFARVFADAVLCDLDDAETDRLHGTATLATAFGRRRAWNIALAVRLALAGVLLIIPTAPLTVRALWAGVTMLSSVGLRLLAPPDFSDWIDARFAVEAAAVSLILWLF
jgi:4-hydroxybenzoate polyprenyltransferase